MLWDNISVLCNIVTFRTKRLTKILNKILILLSEQLIILSRILKPISSWIDGNFFMVVKSYFE